MRLDHLLSKEHSPTFGLVRVSAWFASECGALGGSLGGTLSRRTRCDLMAPAQGWRVWGSVVRTKHTVGCLKQHHHAPVGVWLFLMALIPETSDAPYVAGVWVGLVCVV